MIYYIMGGLHVSILFEKDQTFISLMIWTNPLYCVGCVKKWGFIFESKIFRNSWLILGSSFSCHVSPQYSAIWQSRISSRRQRGDPWLAGKICYSCNIIGWHSSLSDLFTQLQHREVSSENSNSEEQEITDNKYFIWKSSQITRKFFFNPEESLIV